MTVLPPRLQRTTHLSSLNAIRQTTSHGLDSSRMNAPVRRSQSLTRPSFPDSSRNEGRDRESIS